MRSPTLLPMRMNAAETSASNAMADCTLLAVVSRSWTTAEMDTFISEVSTTSTNMAMAKSSGSRRSVVGAPAGSFVIGSVTAPSWPRSPSPIRTGHDGSTPPCVSATR